MRDDYNGSDKLFSWGGYAGQRDIHMIATRSGKTGDVKTGSPPKMKGEALERWRLAREDAEIERMMR